MVYLGSNIFRGKKAQEAYNKTISGRIQLLIKKNHFLYFGLPFMLSIVVGSVYLSNFTAIKWEKYDLKHYQMNESEMLNMIENKRSVDKKKDWYKLQGFTMDDLKQREDKKKLEKGNDDLDYEMIRVKRKKEDEPVW